MLTSEFPSCNTCLQLNCLINKYCSPKWKSFLAENKFFRLYSKKQTVFTEGGLISGFYFIYDGKIKVFNTGEKGKQNIIRLAASGEMPGLNSFSETKYLISATALEDASLCFFEKKVFIKTLRKNPEFAWQLLDFYAHQLSNIETQHKNFNLLTAKGKIAEALLLVKDKFGKMFVEDEYLLDVVLSRQEIADIAGTCVAESIRTLTLLKKEQLIKINKQKIIISNHDKLQKFILAKCTEKRKTV